jgi:hypothetical protein
MMCLLSLRISHSWTHGCQHISDGRGTSIVLARSPLADDVLRNGIASGELAMQPIDAERVIASQADVVQEKRRALSWRLWLADRDGLPRPRKRIRAKRPGRLDMRLLLAREAVRTASFEAMAAQRESSPAGLNVYDKAMRDRLGTLHKQLRLRYMAARITAVPRKVCRLILRKGR